MNYCSVRPFTVIGPAIVIGCLVAGAGDGSRFAVQAMVLVGAVCILLLLYIGRAPPLARMTVLVACAIQFGLVVGEGVNRHHQRRPTT